jgi:uncharacterized iron-regulated membrane protein
LSAHPNTAEEKTVVTKNVAPAKLPLRRWVRVAHLWAGMILGLWLVMLGLTGSALVYQHSLRQVFEQGRKIKLGVPALAIEDLLARVRQQRPDITIFGLQGMQYKDSAVEVLVRPSIALRDAKQSRVLLVDPGTGEIGGTQSFSGTLMGFFAQLHFNLLNGDTGLAINGFAGALAIFFAVTGLILWWRGRSKWKNGLRIKWKGASSRVRGYSIHSAVGAYASLFFFVTGLSGIYLAAPKPFISFAARLNGSSIAIMKEFLASRPSSETKPGMLDALAGQILKAGQSQFPTSQLVQVTLPIRPTDAWRLQFRPPGWADSGAIELAVVDRRSARVLAAQQTSDLPVAFRAVLFLRPLHYGSFGGDATRVLWLLLGVTPAVLFVTGLVIWRKRIAAVTKPAA